MLVRISPNDMGHLTMMPVNERMHRKYRDHLRKFAVSGADDGSVYLQVDTDIESLLESIPRGASQAIREGWGATVRMDAWTYGAYVGYDASDSVTER